MKNRGIVIWIAVFIAFSCFGIVGCEYFPESSFQLASESRLPKWISLPAGLTRTNSTVTMSYYSTLWGDNVKVTLRNDKEQIVATVHGREKKGGPFHLKKQSAEFPSGYPLYEVVTANGITEIIEHRRMEPIFYVTDDPQVRSLISADH